MYGATQCPVKGYSHDEPLMYMLRAQCRIVVVQVNSTFADLFVRIQLAYLHRRQWV